MKWFRKKYKASYMVGFLLRTRGAGDNPLSFYIQSLLHMTEYFRIARGGWGDGGRGMGIGVGGKCMCVCLCVCVSVTAISQKLLGRLQPNFASHHEMCSSCALRKIVTSSFLMTSYQEKLGISRVPRNQE